MDRKWWNEYGMRIKAGPELWTTHLEAARLWKLHHIRGEAGAGVSSRANTIRLGENSGFQGLQLALHFGAARVILLGYDMRFIAGRSHWHGDHVKLGNPLESRFAKWRASFAQIPYAVRMRIVNATPGTALECFPKRPLRDCLA